MLKAGLALVIAALFVGAAIAAARVFVYVLCGMICIATVYVMLSVFSDICKQIKKGR